MTDDDKTPVDTTCGAPIRDRSGRELGYVCNLTRGHLGRHAQVYENSPGRWEQVVDDAK